MPQGGLPRERFEVDLEAGNPTGPTSGVSHGRPVFAIPARTAPVSPSSRHGAADADARWPGEVPSLLMAAYYSQRATLGGLMMSEATPVYGGDWRGYTDNPRYSGGPGAEA